MGDRAGERVWGGVGLGSLMQLGLFGLVVGWVRLDGLLLGLAAFLVVLVLLGCVVGCCVRSGGRLGRVLLL